MQTFLPYPDFIRSAEALDVPRLGKQRVETLQVARALELFDYGWSTHPAVRMWRGHTPALVAYGLAVADVWTRGGRADTTAALIAEFAPEMVGRDQSDLAAAELLPPWLGDERLHRSHRSALVRKDPAFYRPEFGDVPDDLPYFWPEQPVGAPSLGDVHRDSGITRMWVLRATSVEQFDEFRRRRIVGCDTASGIDVDASVGTVDGLRLLLARRAPGRRPTKALRVLASFVSDVAVGDAVAVPIPDEPDSLRLAEVVGEYAFSARSDTLAPHRRRVRWRGTIPRSDIAPPALLQNPRTLFPLPVSSALFARRSSVGT